MELLQVEPGWMYVKLDSFYVDLMDKILGQLWEAAKAGSISSWADATGAVALPKWDPAHCRLLMLLPFLSTGKKALREAALQGEARYPKLSADRRSELQTELMLIFDFIAQREMQLVCGGCAISGPCPMSDRVPGRQVAAPVPPA